MKMRPVGAVGDWVQLLRMDRPVGYWLLLWPTLWGLLAASHGRPEPKNLLIFVTGVFLMRSAGCVINDFADRGFDPHVERTRDRPIAAGCIAPGTALAGFVFMLFIALLLVSQTSPLVVELAVAGVLLAAIYPFMKRFTHFPQAWLGMAFGWGAVMAWAAETGNVTNSPIPWLLFAANICWSLSYDTAYAIGDRADDMKINVKSTALWLGDRSIAAVIGSGIVMLAFLAAVSWQYGVLAWFGWVLAASWQLWLFSCLARKGEAWSFPFFLKSHWTGMLFCLGFVVS
ncbi:MAG: 4-hydroxybenzoate octaprenyltransferase [Mariprofundaceae bacterium]|nr:4-hydroxybenzoate octaprenyltransferase [Mariprofundaceae bacterium]